MRQALSLCAFAAALLLVGNAFALTSEQGSEQGGTGAAQLADPDDKVPNYVTLPDREQGAAALTLYGATTTPSAPGTYDSGAAAFEHAYDHLSNQ